MQFDNLFELGRRSVEFMRGAMASDDGAQVAHQALLVFMMWEDVRIKSKSNEMDLMVDDVVDFLNSKKGGNNE